MNRVHDETKGEKMLTICRRKVCCIVGALVFCCISGIMAQNNDPIYFKYCTIHPDDNCFEPLSGAVDTVGRDIYELGGGYRFCLKLDTVDAGFAPIRVALVLDKSYSMCRNAGVCCTDGDGTGNCMMNDPFDQRIKGAQLFVDSLAAKSPRSEVGVVAYDRTATSHQPIPLNSAENIQQVKDWINEASCVYAGYPPEELDEDDDDSPGGLGKTSAVKATYLGLGLQNGLTIVDTDFGTIPEEMKRHVILLTDGAWDDATEELGRAPSTVIANYTTRNPGRPVPVIHGVFLSNEELHLAHEYPKEGCSTYDPVVLDNLELASTLGSEAGLFFSGSTPQTVVANFDSLLKRMSVVEEKQLTHIIVTNEANGTVRGENTITEVESPTPDSVHYEATIDNLPLEFGLNTLKIQSIVQAGEAPPETTTATVSIFRTDEWTTRIIPEEYQEYCVKDSTTISITVSPEHQLMTKPYTVNSTIILKEKMSFDTVEVRVFTQCPDGDQNTVGLFRFEENLINSVNGTAVTGSSIAYNTTDALFGSGSLKGGLFSTPISTIAQDFALETWINPASNVVATEIFSIGGFKFGIKDDKRLYMVIGEAEVVSEISVDVNTWSHIAVSRTNGAVIMFINGINASAAAPFADALAGAVTVKCPAGAFIDEVRISNSGRLRTDSKLVRFDVPSVQDAAWSIAGAAYTQSYAILSPQMWTSGNIEFQFTSSVPGRLVVNFQHRGTSIETQWAKNGNPVFAASDLQGPYVDSAIFTFGPMTGTTDTLRIFFSELVNCALLKQILDPGASFRIYNSNNVWKDSIFLESYYKDGSDCLDEYIREVTVIVRPRSGVIDPDKDLIQLLGQTTDTAGNTPDTTKRGPIKYGPGSGIVIAPYSDPSSGHSPMLIPQGMKDRTGEHAFNFGKFVIIQTRGLLAQEPDGSYGSAVLFDPVANIIRTDLKVKQFAQNSRMYYILWDGANSSGRRVASGAYFLRAKVRYANNKDKVFHEKTKLAIKWNSDS